MNRDTSPRSRAATIWVVLLVGYWLTLLTATHLPPAYLTELPRTSSDKLLHAGAYAVLAFLLAAAWHASMGRLNNRHFWFAWWAIVAFGVVDELTQLLVARDAELGDWLADAVGAAAGLAMFRIWRAVVDRTRRRRSAT